MASPFRVGASEVGLRKNLVTLVLKKRVGAAFWPGNRKEARFHRESCVDLCSMQMPPSIELAADDDDFEDEVVPAQSAKTTRQEKTCNGKGKSRTASSSQPLAVGGSISGSRCKAEGSVKNNGLKCVRFPLQCVCQHFHISSAAV